MAQSWTFCLLGPVSLEGRRSLGLSKWTYCLHSGDASSVHHFCHLSACLQLTSASVGEARNAQGSPGQAPICSSSTPLPSPDSSFSLPGPQPLLSPAPKETNHMLATRCSELSVHAPPSIFSPESADSGWRLGPRWPGPGLFISSGSGQRDIKSLSHRRNRSAAVWACMVSPCTKGLRCQARPLLD